MGQSGSVGWSIGKPPEPTFTIGQAPESTPEWSVGSPTPTQPPLTTPPPSEGPATPPVPGSGVEGGETFKSNGWLMDALTGPLTTAGKLLRGKDTKPTLEERNQQAITGKPPSFDNPLIDLSTGVEEGHLKGVAQALSGFTSPSQLPLMAAPGARGISAIFAATTVPQLMEEYQARKAAIAKGDIQGKQEAEGRMAALTVMGAMASYHAMDKPPSQVYLNKEDRDYLTGMLQSHIEKSAENGDHAGVHDGIESFASLLPSIAEPRADRRVTEGINPAGEERRSLEQTPQGQAAIYRSMLEETVANDKKALAATSNPEDIKRITSHLNDFQELLDAHNESSTVQAKADIPLRKARYPSGQEPSTGSEALLPAETQEPREENLRDDSGATRGEGTATPASSLSSEQEGDGGATSEGLLRLYGDPEESTSVTHTGINGWKFTGERSGGNVEDEDADYREVEGPHGLAWIKNDELTNSQRAYLEDKTENKVSQLSTLVPEFEKTVSGQASSPATSSKPEGPVISEAIDNDLKKGGITVVRGGKDIGSVARFLGSLTQAANRLGNPLFKMVADRIVDTTLAISRNTRDSLVGFRKNVRSIVNPKEWDQVVDLLDDPSVTKANLSPTLPSNIRDAYNFTRDLLDRHREQARDAKRLEMVAGGMSLAKAKTLIPDDWGIKDGYYVHAFPGTWTITEHTGVDSHGTPIFEPIDTGWRATTLSEAQGKAREYLANNPSANLKVQLDNVTLPGRGIADRNRLRNLHDDIKAASMMIYNGANPDGVMAQLEKQSAGATFGPRRPAPKSFGPTLERESNLPGFVRDLDHFEQYIQGMERYIQLAPARAEIMRFRNAIAQQSHMTEVLKPGDFPKRYSGDYHNMLGRLDASIEALEGYPTGFDAALRHQFEKFGYDPNLLNRAYSTVNSAEALFKLGFNPSSAGLHLAQTIVATYPVLGEKWTGYGIAHSYDRKYDSLVHDLAIESTTKLLDVDTYKAYREGYKRSITESSSVGEGARKFASTGWHDLQASGLFMFSKGVETARRVAAIGAYEKALSEGKTAQEARNYARDTLIRTQFLYNPIDTPIAFRALPRSMTQFKNFTIKMMEFMYGISNEAYHGKPAPLARFIIGMGAIGFAGMPLLGALSGLVKYLFNYDPESELKRAFPKASRGVLGELGIDYTKNVGFSDWLGGHSMDPKSLVGPGVSDISNAIKAAAGYYKLPSKEGQDDIDTAFRNISPEARRLWDEGVRIAGKPDLTNPRTGGLVLKNLTPRERLEMAAGFTPIRVAEERDTHEYIRNQVAEVKDKKGWFVDKMASLAIDLSSPKLSEAEKMETFRQIVSLSKMAESYGVADKLPKAVIDRAKELQSERLLRDVKKAPRQERLPAYQEYQRFNQENQP